MAKKERKSDHAGLFVPAGTLIGFGLGFIFKNIPAGMFSGLGMGFLMFGIFKIFKKD